MDKVRTKLCHKVLLEALKIKGVFTEKEAGALMHCIETYIETENHNTPHIAPEKNAEFALRKY